MSTKKSSKVSLDSQLPDVRLPRETDPRYRELERAAAALGLVTTGYSPEGVPQLTAGPIAAASRHLSRSRSSRVAASKGASARRASKVSNADAHVRFIAPLPPPQTLEVFGWSSLPAFQPSEGPPPPPWPLAPTPFVLTSDQQTRLARGIATLRLVAEYVDHDGRSFERWMPMGLVGAVRASGKAGMAAAVGASREQVVLRRGPR